VDPESMPEVCNCTLRFDHLSIEQGLSQSSVRAIFQDSRGFLWFGTEDGLNRYDGYEFSIYKPDPDAPGKLSDRWITSMVEDKNGFLWIGTRQGGLNRFDHRTGQFATYQHASGEPDSLSNNHINALFIDDDNRLWIGTSDGLDLLETDKPSFTHFSYDPRKANSLSGRNVTTIYQDHKGRYWVGTAYSGLNHFDPQTGNFTTYLHDPNDETSISNNRVTSIEEDANRVLWIGTQNGLNRFDPETEIFTPVYHDPSVPDSLANNNISALYSDRSGNLWVGTSDGLDRMSKYEIQFTHYYNQPSYPKSLSNNNILSIYEDHSGVLWFGTYGSGVNKYDRERDKFAYFRNDPDDPKSLSGNFIFSVLPDENNNTWIGTYGDGLNRFNRSTGKVIRFEYEPEDPYGLGSGIILSLIEDHEGMLWIGTGGNGLDRYNPTNGTFTHYRNNPAELNSLSGNFVYTVFEDSHNNIWVGTNGGLDRLDRETGDFIHYLPVPGDPRTVDGNNVDVIFEDRDGYLWVGTFENGLHRLDMETGNFTRYQSDPENNQSLSNDSVLSIYQDSKDRIWIGTAGGGLNLYHPETDTFTYFLERDGLPNGVVYGILEDDNGYLWMSTNFGISRFDPETSTFRNYDAGDGLQSNEFNQGAFAKSESGEFYFGGIEGLTIFDPLEITDNPRVPQITLTSVTQDGNPLETDVTTQTVRNITLEWPQDSFEFEFAALSFNQSSKNQYAYTLQGFENKWNYIGTKRNGRYTNLPGGTYTLLLRATNSDGVWNQTPLRVNVTVVPPFWETLWFRILFGITLVALMALGIRFRIQSVQDRNRQLERVVRERTSALETRNQEIQALYQADERILRNVTLQQVFQTLVDVAVDTLNADRSVVFAWDEEKNKVMPRVSRGFSPETLKALSFDKGEGIIGNVFETGEPAIVRHVRQVELNEFRQDIREALIAEGVRSFVHLPIFVDQKIVGVFNVGFTSPNLIGDDITRLFSALTQRASISIANMELFEQTKDLAVMEERNRLARDLHDSAKQKAFAALAQLGTVRGILNGNGNSATMHLNEAENLVSDVIQELTFLVQEIYPIALQEKGLPAVMREYAFEWENRNEIKVNLALQNERRLPLGIEQAIYRVTQESLANIARHSNAKRVDISLMYNGGSLQLAVADDGCGFDMDLKGHGLGLRSIRERVSSVHGTVQIQSAPGAGTRIIVQVPTKD
jgi:ligand-binding sensor domain-containing protein/signal transduction histidine kinase